MTEPSHKFCVAPMMDGTDRHCRFFHRLMTKRTLLYTEMITAQAVVRGDRDYLLGFDPAEHPVALQVGGSDPSALAEAARIGADFGYDEINLNIGCPSDRVQSGAFGACLMKTPALVADCIRAMIDAVQIPVTVKCRLGVDDQEPSESLYDFVSQVSEAGCGVFIVHARKAWLQGLSPKENRSVPPLDYDLVKKLKRDRPDLTIILNGGVASVRQAKELLPGVDGVMLGRAAYSEPFMLSSADEEIFEEKPSPLRREDVVREMSRYVKTQAKAGVRPHSITRHMLGLYHGAPGARAWRRFLSEHASDGRDDILDRALDDMMSAKTVACYADA